MSETKPGSPAKSQRHRARELAIQGIYEWRLSGKSAIITGASGGLGSHFARLLAGAGAAVALTARRLDMVEALAGETAGSGGRAMALRLDVADAASIAPDIERAWPVRALVLLMRGRAPAAVNTA